MEISLAPDYVIHENGEIWSKERVIIKNNGKIQNLKSQLIKSSVDGRYLRVSLTVDKKGKHFLVHRLIATAFIPNPNNLRCVNHKNGDKLNNSISNLEWCDNMYNTQSINTTRNFGNVYKTQCNTYQARYRSNGITHCKCFKTEAEAVVNLVIAEIFIRFETQLVEYSPLM
tara:strand:- start:3618 stop:4130 length:513 start_codon:yes stop_codon:yes gene_type:complete